MKPIDEYVTWPEGPLIGVGTDFSIRPLHHTDLPKWLDDPTMTTNGKSIGERNREYLHEKLDEFILRHGREFPKTEPAVILVGMAGGKVDVRLKNSITIPEGACLPLILAK